MADPNKAKSKTIKHCDRRDPKPCTRELNINNPHTRCMGHNESCFVNYTYDPTDCTHCLTLIDGFKTKNVALSAIFRERITAMRRSVKYAYSNSKARAKLTLPVIQRHEMSNGTEVFADRAKHLDPRPRSISPTQASATPVDQVMETQVVETPVGQDVPLEDANPSVQPVPAPLSSHSRSPSVEIAREPRSRSCKSRLFGSSSSSSSSPRPRKRRSRKRTFCYSSSSDDSSHERRAERRKKAHKSPDKLIKFLKSSMSSLRKDITTDISTFQKDIHASVGKLQYEVHDLRNNQD